MEIENENDEKNYSKSKKSAASIVANTIVTIILLICLAFGFFFIKSSLFRYDDPFVSTNLVEGEILSLDSKPSVEEHSKCYKAFVKNNYPSLNAEPVIGQDTSYGNEITTTEDTELCKKVFSSLSVDELNSSIVMLIEKNTGNVSSLTGTSPSINAYLDDNSFSLYLRLFLACGMLQSNGRTLVPYNCTYEQDGPPHGEVPFGSIFFCPSAIREYKKSFHDNQLDDFFAMLGINGKDIIGIAQACLKLYGYKSKVHIVERIKNANNGEIVFDASKKSAEMDSSSFKFNDEVFFYFRESLDKIFSKVMVADKKNYVVLVTSTTKEMSKEIRDKVLKII